MILVHNCFTGLIPTFYTIKTEVDWVHNLIWAIKRVFVPIKCLFLLKCNYLNDNNCRIIWEKCNRFRLSFIIIISSKKMYSNFYTLSTWTKTMENEFNSILFNHLVNCDILSCGLFRIKLILLWYLFNRNEKNNSINVFFFGPTHEPYKKNSSKRSHLEPVLTHLHQLCVCWRALRIHLSVTFIHFLY